MLYIAFENYDTGGEKKKGVCVFVVSISEPVLFTPALYTFRPLDVVCYTFSPRPAFTRNIYYEVVRTADSARETASTSTRRLQADELVSDSTAENQPSISVESLKSSRPAGFIHLFLLYDTCTHHIHGKDANMRCP